jgi:hypothetical protein
MSHDLWFRSRRGAVDPAAVTEHFRARPGYQTAPGHVLYHNGDTGVHFVLEVEPEDGGDPETPPLQLLLKLSRPSYFADEIEPEVTAFVRRFDLLVADPQADGDYREYEPKDVFAAWRDNNAMAAKALAAHAGKVPLQLPRERLHAAWRWSHARKARQQALGQGVFVPVIRFANVGGTVQTACAWTDAVPVLLPRVDCVLLPRDELAPRRWLRREKDVAFASWQQLEPLLHRFGVGHESGGLLLGWRQPPADVVRFVAGLPKQPPSVSIVDAANVLDREFFAP